MKPIVYIDVLFGVNLIINCALLILTAKLGRLPMIKWRIATAGVMGALYAVFMFFPSMGVIYSTGAKLIFSCLAVAVAYNIHGVRLYFKALGIFYLTTLCFGGGVFALCCFTRAGAAVGAIISNGVFYMNLPWQVLLVAVGGSYIVIRVVWNSMRGRLQRENMCVGISIFLDGKRVDLNALIDTGNTLYDPLTSAPVIVVEYGKIKELLPGNARCILEKDGGCNAGLWHDDVAQTNLKLRLIPFSSLGTENGMLMGFKPDKVAFYLNEQTNETDDIIVGVYSKRLTRDGSYSALLHPEVIRRDYELF